MQNSVDERVVIYSRVDGEMLANDDLLLKKNVAEPIDIYLLVHFTVEISLLLMIIFEVSPLFISPQWYNTITRHSRHTHTPEERCYAAWNCAYL